MNDSQIASGLPGAIDHFARCTIATMAVAAGCRWGDCRVAGFFDCVMAVATVKLELTGMKLVTERDGLSWFVAHVDDFRVNCRKQASREEASDSKSTDDQHDRELVDPSRKMKFLHGLKDRLVEPIDGLRIRFAFNNAESNLGPRKAPFNGGIQHNLVVSIGSFVMRFILSKRSPPSIRHKILPSSAFFDPIKCRTRICRGRWPNVFDACSCVKTSQDFTALSFELVDR